MKPPADVQKWATAAAEAKASVAEERELRAQIIAKYFPTYEAGTNVVDVGAGYRLAAVFSEHIKLDADKTEAVLAKFPKADPAGAVLAQRLVKWSVELRIGEWNKLPDKLKKLMTTAVVSVGPTKPTLELREPA